MNTAIIRATDLTKTYRVPDRGEGLRAAIRHLSHPQFTEIPALQNVSFQIQPGEMIGLIGPNGAGKTSLLKIAGGLLHPSSGTIISAGFIPWERKPEYLRKISMVLGNKSQLIWDIPALDTFKVLAAIYRIPESEFQVRLKELVSMLEMETLLTRPVRNLSLGERMKCELAAGLLHHPSILFLDEPTLGLDISIQAKLRSFIGEYNHLTGATIILTSHYMADVTSLCERVILLHQGRILYDGDLSKLAIRLSPFKVIQVSGLIHNEDVKLNPEIEILFADESQATLRIPREKTPELIAHLLNTCAINDLTVEDPPIEAVIDQVFREGDACLI